MDVNISGLTNSGDRVAVALSGGSDSMALLHYLLSCQKSAGIQVCAINVEHGLRGAESLRDTEFVKTYCKNSGVTLFTYSVDAAAFSKQNGLTIEEGARKLRYDCFYDALKNNKCDKIATAHHAGDNLESILINLFRGTSLKGLTGITENFENVIIRPFIRVPKSCIDKYVADNDIPFVTDSTNLQEDYTRNYLRLNVIPAVKKVFPEAERAISRMTALISQDEQYLEELSQEIVHFTADGVKIDLPAPKPLFSRAAISAMKYLGIKKDWEAAHINDLYALIKNTVGKKVTLPNGVTAIRQYNDLLLIKEKSVPPLDLPFNIGEFNYNGKTYTVKKVKKTDTDLKSGLFIAVEKLPKNAVIRTACVGDVFKKFGGGEKPLSDFFTDKKIPLVNRKDIPVVADGRVIYAVFGHAVSQLTAADEKTEELYKIK